MPFISSLDFLNFLSQIPGSEIVLPPGPYVLLGWAWWRWFRTAPDNSVRAWHARSTLVALTVASATAMWLLPHLLNRFAPEWWPWFPENHTFMKIGFFSSVIAFMLSLVAKGATRVLLCLACACIGILWFILLSVPYGAAIGP